MKCQTAVELLPWLLNGSLDPAEKEGVERHLRDCEECRSELEATRAAAGVFAAHPSAEALVAFVAGEEPRDLPRELVERHLTHCPSCAEEVALLREGRSRLSLDTAEVHPRSALAGRPAAADVPTGRLLRGPWSASRWRALAAAAGIAAVVLSGASLWNLLGGGSVAPLTAEREAAERRIAELEQEGSRLQAAVAAGGEAAEAAKAEADELRGQLDLARGDLARLTAEQARIAESARRSAGSSGSRLSLPVGGIYPEGTALRGSEPDPGAEVTCASDPCTLVLPLDPVPETDEVRIRVLAADGSVSWEERKPGVRGWQVLYYTAPRSDLPRGQVTIEVDEVGREGAGPRWVYRFIVR